MLQVFYDYFIARDIFRMGDSFNPVRDIAQPTVLFSLARLYDLWSHLSN